MRSRYLLAAVAASAALPAGGQTVHGSVRDAGTRQPIAGAVAMVLDPAGAVLGRGLSGQDGQYKVSARDGRVLRVVRIGYRPRELLLDRHAADSIEIDVTMERLPTMLEPVRVTRSARCAKDASDERAYGLLQQARAGLLATIAARELLPAKMVRLNFDRTAERGGDRFDRQRVYIDSGTGLRVSFASARSAPELATLGFTAVSADKAQYFGPDADVLLDDAFAASYCFRLVAATPDRAQQMGIGFTPARRRAGRVDVDGVLWVDTTARELRDLEFRYLGLDRRSESVHPGGHVGFRSIPNGIAIVDQWWLHVPAVWVDTQYLDTRRIERSGVLLREAGGEVARAEWPDGSHWHASLGELRGRTVDDTGAPLAGIKVGLAETDYRATSDSSGYFDIVDLAPGSYRITAVEPDLSRLGISLVTAQEFVAKRDSVLDVVVRVPSTEAYVDRGCRSDVADSGEQGGATSGRLIGRVVQRDGKPLADVSVDVELVDDVSGPRSVAGGGVTDVDGMFHLCRWIPAGRTVIVRARAAAGAPVSERVQMNAGVTMVKLRLP